MNRFKLLKNVSTAKKEIINRKESCESMLSDIAMSSMGKEIINSQGAWELKGKILAYKQALKIMGEHGLWTEEAKND